MEHDAHGWFSLYLFQEVAAPEPQLVEGKNS